MRNLEMPGRSPVHAPHGMASTSQPLSSQAAIDVLKAGGNALDAAVAACAVQCVVEPESTGIGGDCFCLYSKGGSDDIIAFNGSGKAPQAATIDWCAAQGITEIERHTPHAVTVPGAVDAWVRLVGDHGSKPLGELLAPAIGYARDGYPVGSRVAFDMANELETLNNSEAAAAVFLTNGKPPKAGDMHRQPLLADTLEKIAKHGRDAFYLGEVADDMVALLQSRGGLHTARDFKDVHGDYVDPISATFRDLTIYQCPPNGQGVIALLLLNLMSGFDLGEGGPLTLERVHREVEAGRIAYHDRALYLADPAFADVPVDRLLSTAHAHAQRARIEANHRIEDLAAYTGAAHPSTVYISVVDKDRNCCSFINTLFSGFGSGLMAPKSGVMLHNRGTGFVVEAGHPNCIGPGKRPLHTIIPGMACKDGRAVMPFGVMGGQYQAFGHMQFLTRLLDYGLDIQEAMDCPRFFPDPKTGVVEVESGVPSGVAEGLQRMGYKTAPAAKPIGGSQAVWVDWDSGVLTGGSDPRKDGAAMGY